MEILVLLSSSAALSMNPNNAKYFNSKTDRFTHNIVHFCCCLLFLFSEFWKERMAEFYTNWECILSLRYTEFKEFYYVFKIIFRKKCRNIIICKCSLQKHEDFFASDHCIFKHLLNKPSRFWRTMKWYHTVTSHLKRFYFSCLASFIYLFLARILFLNHFFQCLSKQRSFILEGGKNITVLELSKVLPSCGTDILN